MNSPRLLRFLRRSAAFAGAVAVAMNSWAQATATPAGTRPNQAATSGSEPDKIELSPFEVSDERVRGYISTNSVGATKVNTPLSDIPSAVVVLPRTLIDDVRPLKALDVLRYASGVTENFNTLDRYVMRGQSSEGFYRDGFRTRIVRSDLHSVEQIEVLKGVQGVLYGSVGLNGLVNLVSKLPTFRREGSLTAVIGDGNHLEGALDWTDRLSDKTGYRLVGAQISSEPQVFDNLEQDRTVLYGSAVHRFTPNVSLTGLFEYTDTKETLLNGTWFDPATGQPSRGGALLRTNSSFSEDSFFEDNGMRSNLRFDVKFSPDWTSRLTLNHYVQDFIRQQTDSRFAALPASGAINRLDAAYSDETEEFFLNLDITGKFKTGALDHRLVLGGAASRFHQDYVIWVWNTFATNVSVPRSGLPAFGARAPYWFTQVSEQRNYEHGAYVLNTTSMLEDRLLFVYGVRYAAADLSGGLKNLGAFGDTTPVAPFAKTQFPASASTRNQSHKNLYRFGVVTKPWRGVSIYGSYNDTYYPSNRIAQNRNGQIQPFPPETGKMRELGIKSELLDSRLVVNAAYYWNRRGPFISYDAAQNLYVENPATPINGFEVDANLYLNERWSAILTYSSVDVEGIAAVSVPDSSWSLWTKYEFKDGPVAGLTLGAGVDYKSDARLFITPLRADERTLLNALVGYRVGRWNFAVNVSNITDESYILHDSGGYDAVVPGEPRRVLFSTTYRF